MNNAYSDLKQLNQDKLFTRISDDSIDYCQNARF